MCKPPFFLIDQSLPGARQGLVFAQVSLLILFALLLSSCAPTQQATAQLIRITVDADGKQLPLQIPSGTTVQAALQNAGITLGNLDRIEPPGYSVLANDDTIQVTRVREVFALKETIVPFEQQTVRNESLPEGQTLLVQRGVNGVQQVTYRQVFENEQEVSNSVIKTVTLVEPLPEVVMIGVQKPFTPVPVPGRLAYLAGGNAWIMENTTGSRRPVVTTGDLDGRIFTLSPKGDWLLFTRGENGAPGEKINSLWAIDVSEEGSKPINLKVDNVIHFAGWVPGKGLTITYSTVEPRATAPGWQANNDLQMLTFATTGTVAKQDTIIETNAGGVYGWWGTNYAWSPGGTYLAYSRPDSIGLVNLETRSLEPLVEILPFQTGSDWAWVPGLGWSQDESVLYFVTHAPKAGLESEEASPLFDLSALPLGDDAPTTAGPLIHIVQQSGMFAYPVPSPKIQNVGFHVAFLQAIFPEQSDSKRYRLVVMDRDGSNRQVVFPPEDYQGLDPQQVAWSPVPFDNGSLWLAVIYQGNLYLVDSDTGETQQVTGDGLLNRVVWK